MTDDPSPERRRGRPPKPSDKRRRQLLQIRRPEIEREFARGVLWLVTHEDELKADAAPTEEDADETT